MTAIGCRRGGMADALRSGRSPFTRVKVQVLSSAPLLSSDTSVFPHFFPVFPVSSTDYLPESSRGFLCFHILVQGLCPECGARPRRKDTGLCSVHVCRKTMKRDQLRDAEAPDRKRWLLLSAFRGGRDRWRGRDKPCFTRERPVSVLREIFMAARCSGWWNGDLQLLASFFRSVRFLLSWSLTYVRVTPSLLRWFQLFSCHVANIVFFKIL